MPRWWEIDVSFFILQLKYILKSCIIVHTDNSFSCFFLFFYYLLCIGAVIMVGTKVNVQAAELLFQQARDFELRRVNLYQNTEQLRR